MNALPGLFALLLGTVGPATAATTPTPPSPTEAFLPPAEPGRAWRLVWHDEFEGTRLDETKWNRLGDWKRRDGFWIKDDAYLSGQGTLLIRTPKDGDRYTSGAINTQGKSRKSGAPRRGACRRSPNTSSSPRKSATGAVISRKRSYPTSSRWISSGSTT